MTESTLTDATQSDKTTPTPPTEVATIPGDDGHARADTRDATASTAVTPAPDAGATTCKAPRSMTTPVTSADQTSTSTATPAPAPAPGGDHYDRHDDTDSRVHLDRNARAQFRDLDGSIKSGRPGADRPDRAGAGSSS